MFHFVFFLMKPVTFSSSSVFPLAVFSIPRIHVGAGSRQKARHLPGVLLCFQTSSADVPGSECEGQPLSAFTRSLSDQAAGSNQKPLNASAFDIGGVVKTVILIILL